MVALVFIGVITLFQWLLLSLGDPKLFDIVPVRFLFDGMDVAIFVAFLVFGTLEAINVFRGRHE
jgi:hypothetical protein